MKNLTPREIVKELDKYIVGQEAAKKAVAIAIRNRWRRQQLPKELRQDVIPKNILMIGPTGVGKTEIARRLSLFIQAPFLKVEATKFTEVGYHGRDVDSMIRDLVDVAISMVRREKMEEMRSKVKRRAEKQLLDLLVNHYKRSRKIKAETPKALREEIRKKLRQGELDEVEITVSKEQKPPSPMIEVLGPPPDPLTQEIFQDLFEQLAPTTTKKIKMTVREALNHFAQEESERLLDKEAIQKEALERVENSGIIFLDEIDKITGPKSMHGPDVSREGVQRDLLPIIEGTTVATRYGPVRTDHILFIAAGAFHVSKPSDLIPELQGRFPIRVELSSLGEEDLFRILTEPKNALTKQYKALLEVEGVELEFEEEALRKVAQIAAKVNATTQDIGARRLHTIMEKLMEDYLYEAPYGEKKKILIDSSFVTEKLSQFVENEDLSHFIL